MKRFVGMGNVRVSAVSHALGMIKGPLLDTHLDKKVKADLKDWYRKYLHKEERP